MPSLSEFPVGGSLFVDANIVLAHLLWADRACSTLLQRVQRGEIRAMISVVAWAEVRHRLLLTEAVRQGSVPAGRSALDALRHHPEILRSLGRCDEALAALLETGIRLVSVPPAQFRVAQRLSLRYHLLTNDALHLAVMRAHRLRHLASADRDFLHIPRLTLWKT